MPSPELMPVEMRSFFDGKHFVDFTPTLKR